MKTTQTYKQNSVKSILAFAFEAYEWIEDH